MHCTFCLNMQFLLYYLAGRAARFSNLPIPDGHTVDVAGRRWGGREGGITWQRDGDLPEWAGDEDGPRGGIPAAGALPLPAEPPHHCTVTRRVPR